MSSLTSEPGVTPTAVSSTGDPSVAPSLTDAAGGKRGQKRAKRSMVDRFEDYFSRLSSKSTFWHRVGSMIWLPYAFKSGIRMQKVDDKTFSAVLPFRRFNRNWYNAMAGASLLANSEIAGGMYIYGRCGGDYTVVCKKISYEFLRPCFGPAIYRVTPLADLDAMLATGKEFNFPIELNIVQHLPLRSRDTRVGLCNATFHITPKALHAAREARRARGSQQELSDRNGAKGGKARH